MKRVLVVEPHPQVLDALSDLVEDEPGLELAGAVSTVHEAISLARNIRPDVVLVDVDESSWRANRLGQQINGLLPFALLIRMSAVTDPEPESLRSTENSPPNILKSAIPEILRSLTE